MRLVLGFATVLAVVIACGSAQAEVKLSGSFVADRACPATQSIKTAKNPGNVATEAGKSYDLLAGNRDMPTHYLIEVPGAEPDRRWVKVGCGHLGDGHLRMHRGEAFARTPFPRDHLHAFRVQPQQTGGQALRGQFAVGGGLPRVAATERAARGIGGARGIRGSRGACRVLREPGPVGGVRRAPAAPRTRRTIHRTVQRTNRRTVHRTTHRALRRAVHRAVPRAVRRAVRQARRT